MEIVLLLLINGVLQYLLGSVALWAANTLFALGIAYTFTNFCAAGVLMATVRMTVSASTSRRS
jgi:hypothetical protein